ncbi:MAG: response regulator, partial [Anaerolineae bacterium]
LIVDDDRGFAQLVRRMLRAMRPDCEVAWASTAQQALARLADDPWDVMLVDISLPDMDGRGLARMVRDGAAAACGGDAARKRPRLLALSGMQPGEGRSQPAGTLFSLSVRTGLRERELLALLSSCLRAAASVHPEPEPAPALPATESATPA